MSGPSSCPCCCCCSSCSLSCSCCSMSLLRASSISWTGSWRLGLFLGLPTDLGLLNSLLFSLWSLGAILGILGLVWFDLAGCLLMTVHCLLIQTKPVCRRTRAVFFLMFVCLFIPVFGFFVCLFWLLFFFFFVRFLGFYVSSWRLIFIYCLSREPCSCFLGFCYLASLLAFPSMTFHSHSSLCRCHARRWHSMVQ